MNMMRKAYAAGAGSVLGRGQIGREIELLRMQIQKKLVKGKSISEDFRGT